MNRRLAPLATALAAALLAACASQPSQTLGESNPLPQATTNNPAVAAYPSGTYPATTVVTPAAATEWGRVTDIQSVTMGAAPADNNPNRARNAVVGGVLGAVAGSVVGKNVNGGHNRSAATVLGGAAGAAAGSRIGQSDPNLGTSGAGAAGYRVTVQTDQGVLRAYDVGALGDLRVGDRVRVENGVIYRS